MSHPHSITEKREESRANVDMPVIMFYGDNSSKVGKVVELSIKRARILYLELPEINSRLELRFTIPTESVSPELRIESRVRHTYKILSMPGTPPECQYVAGVEFLNINPYAQALLAEFL